MITEAMSYLDDNWQRLPEEVYLEMGRKLADAQDAVPQLYRVVSFVVDGETKIAKVLENAANDVGAPVAVTGFVRFALGEGIERKEEDFAAEVAKVANA